jgi:hypothetical protein
MIRPLRQRHARIFAVLAVSLPVAFAVGVAARKPVPTIETLPAALKPETAAFTAIIWSHNDFFSKTPIRAVLLRENAETGRYAIQLFASAHFAKPDLLIYWSRGFNKSGNEIPDGAVLLGVLGESVPMQLPVEISSGSGTLVLYSPADGEVVDVSKPFSL